MMTMLLTYKREVFLLDFWCFLNELYTNKIIAFLGGEMPIRFDMPVNRSNQTMKFESWLVGEEMWRIQSLVRD